MFSTYVRLQKGNWSCIHIWDSRLSTKEYEEMGFTIMILKYD